MPKALKKQNEEVNALREQLARSLADYDNFRKRTLERADQEKLIITSRVIGRFLPILDMLDEAQKHLNDGGLALTIKEFEDTLKSEGIEVIDPKKGEEFTEDLHDVVEVVNIEGIENNKVTETVMRGWKFMDGPVIRHAKVKVNKI